MTDQNNNSIAQLQNASLSFGSHDLWKNLDLTIKPGEFLAVLGPNGSGKSSFLKVLLGQYQLDAGTAQVSGTLGYVPQQHAFDVHLPLRGRDLVQLGLDGNRWGFDGIFRPIDPRVNKALQSVGATSYANKPVGRLSGGEQQRLRVAQALVSRPQLLLCDEPLLSLDIASQRAVSELINSQRKLGTAVVFVTHEINPILPFVDRVLYFVNGKWRIGEPHNVLNSHALSELYGTTVDVVKVRDRIIVVAGETAGELHPHHIHKDAAND
jgi:zinc/manganese transport system ATP-binding protein